MSSFESTVLAYLLNSIWQVPLIFCGALAASWLARKAGPRMEHSVWAFALAFEALLPLCRFNLGDLAWKLVLWLQGGSGGNSEVRIVLGPGAASGLPVGWLSTGLLVALVALYLASILYFAARLAWIFYRTDTIRRRAVSLVPSQETHQQIHRLARLSDLDVATVQLAASPQISGPATVGISQHTLLLPVGFVDALSANDAEALFAHELAHVRRRDFAKNLAYAIVALPVSYHPLLWLTRSRLAETRELICDAMAAETIGGRESYARSLLRVASLLSNPARPRTFHAIGILDANIFERRIMNLTRKPLDLPGARRALVAAACALLAVSTCASAVALRMDVETQASGTEAPKSINVKITDMKILKKVQPVFPPGEKAKKKPIYRKVALDVIVGKDGSVENIKVEDGKGNDFEQSAIDAVRQWQFQPFLLNGDPIEVKTTVNIIYSYQPKS